jgi:transcriptional regulator with XRE-family HTH domain
MLALMGFRENVTALRQERGWNRNQLAEKTGLTATQIKEIEEGKNLNPGLQTLEKIMAALGVTPNEFFLGKKAEVGTEPSLSTEVFERLHELSVAAQRVAEAVGEYGGGVPPKIPPKPKSGVRASFKGGPPKGRATGGVRGS